MKKLTTAFLRTNPIGTACGSVGNIALSNDEVIDFINKFFGGEIFVNDEDDEEGTNDVCEIRAKIHKHITKKDLTVLYEDENLKEAVEEYEELTKDDLVGFIFQYLISEIGDGSARFEEGYLDENDMLFFEVE